MRGEGGGMRDVGKGGGARKEGQGRGMRYKRIDRMKGGGGELRG